MAVAVAKIVWISTGFVNGEFKFERRACGDHLDQVKAFKIQAVFDLEPKSRVVKGDRGGLVPDADHAVYEFCHAVPPATSW